VLFNSLDFAVLLATVLAIYPFLRRRGQNLLLLAASYVFYGFWDWRYLALVFFAAVVDFTAGRGIAAARTQRGRLAWVLCSVAFNLGILAYFKYLGFFVESAVALLNVLGLPASEPVLEIVLPVGISFFTFQSMSYIFDVYRGRTEATASLLDYLLYVSFFPQLAAGPIERAGHMLPQYASERRVTPVAVYGGLLLLLWGLFKKVAVADNLGVYVDAVYGNREEHGGLSLLLATYAFTFQIYCDFSGYSDMAVGMARLLGLEMMMNFRTPYFSESPQEFWRRWHISLSTWFRDYVYIPLGGNHASAPRVAANTMIVFLASGLWHGADWRFVLWGGIHGAYLVAQRWLGVASAPATGARRWLRIFVTFQLVALAWVFFRADSAGDAFAILGTILTDPGELFLPRAMANGVVALAILVAIELAMQPRTFDQWLVERRIPVRPAIAAAVLFGVILLGHQSGARFIYFQF
jgi:alginate O-acetyltransferase complex protein AlgI